MKKRLLLGLFFVVVFSGVVLGQNVEYVVDEALRTTACEASAGWLTDFSFKDASGVWIFHCIRKEKFSTELQFVTGSYMNVLNSGEERCSGGADSGVFSDDNGNSVYLCVKRENLDLSNPLTKFAMTNVAVRKENECPYSRTTFEKITINATNYTHCVESAVVQKPLAECGGYEGNFPQADSSCKYRINLGGADNKKTEGDNFTAPLISGDDDVCPLSLECTCKGIGDANGWQCEDIVDDCGVTNLQWLDVYGNVLNPPRAYGARGDVDIAADTVKLSADFDEGCRGRTIVYELFEEDVYEDDFVIGIVARAGKVETSWQPTLKGPLGNEAFEFGVAEYYFRVEVDGITQKVGSAFLRSPTLTLFVPRCSEVLAACGTEGKCRDAEGVWQNGECLSPEQAMCGQEALEFCGTANTCELDGDGEWIDGLCVSKDRCKSDNLDKCENSEECEIYGGRWDGEMCVEREECTITDAHWEEEIGEMIENPVNVSTDVYLVATINGGCYEDIELRINLGNPRRREQIVKSLSGRIDRDNDEVYASWITEYPSIARYEGESGASYYFTALEGGETLGYSDSLIVNNPEFVVSDDGIQGIDELFLRVAVDGGAGLLGMAITSNPISGVLLGVAADFIGSFLGFW